MSGIRFPGLSRAGNDRVTDAEEQLLVLEATSPRRSAVAAGNVEKTMTAPVTVIVAHDVSFFDRMPRHFPHNPRMRPHSDSIAAPCQGSATRGSMRSLSAEEGTTVDAENAHPNCRLTNSRFRTILVARKY
jgi:hypothetical protein